MHWLDRGKTSTSKTLLLGQLGDYREQGEPAALYAAVASGASERIREGVAWELTINPSVSGVERVKGVVRRVRQSLPCVVVSTDATRTQTLRAAHDAGAELLRTDGDAPSALFVAAAELRMGVELRHRRRIRDGNCEADVAAFLRKGATRAIAAGLPVASVLLNPGIGVNKRSEQSLILLRSLTQIKDLGFRMIVQPPPMSLVCGAEDVTRAASLFHSAAIVALAASAGVKIIRVSDVHDMADVAYVTDAITRGWRPHDWSIP